MNRTNGRPTGGKPVAEWVGNLARSNAIAVHAEELLRLQAVYKRCLPAGLAGTTELANVREGIVFVSALSGPAAHRLRLMGPTILTALRAKGLEVSELRVLTRPPAPRPEAHEKQAVVSPAAREALGHLAAEIPPSPLRSAIERMLGRQRRDPVKPPG
jgi:hypothetical protein